MKKSLLLGALGALAIGAGGMANAGVLDDVKARGVLRCGSNTGLPGFAAPNAEGVWEGFDIAMCRAVAGAIFGDPMKVDVTPTTGQTRFTALASGEIDMLARVTTWSFLRDTELKLDFVGTNFYDGTGFLVPKSLGVTSAKDLDGATVCIQTGTTTELNLSDYFRANGLSYEAVPVETQMEGQAQYLAGACDTYTTDASGLAAMRGTFETPTDHIILPEIISKEPLAITVRHGDQDWADLVRWVFFALVAAEEYGITLENIDEMAKGVDNPEINRLLGVEGELGKQIGLDTTWAINAIKAEGNYGEIFAKYLGVDTPIGLERGINAQWYEGGLQYAPPFR